MVEFELTYNGNTFLIDPLLFCQASTIFGQIYDESIPGMEITNDYSKENFRTFLYAVQNMPYTINEDNVEDLLKLGTEWGVESLVDEVNKYLSLHSVQNSATILLENYERGVPTAELEAHCAKDFNNVFGHEAFLKMPVELLRNVLTHIFNNRIEWKIDDLKLAIAISEILKIHGDNISGFFEKLDFDNLPNIIFYALMSSENFNKANVADKIFNATRKLLTSLKTNRLNAQEELDTANKLLSSTTNRLETLKAETMKAAEKIDTYNDEAESNENYVKAIKERTDKMIKILQENNQPIPSKNKKTKQNDNQKQQGDNQKPQDKKKDKFATYYGPSSQPATPAPAENTNKPQNQQNKQQNQNKNQNKKNKNKNKKNQANSNKFAVYYPPDQQQQAQNKAPTISPENIVQTQVIVKEDEILNDDDNQ